MRLDVIVDHHEENIHSRAYYSSHYSELPR